MGGKRKMFLTIDPGITGTGYAVWSKNWKLKKFGILKSKSKDWHRKMYEVSDLLLTKSLSTEIVKYPEGVAFPTAVLFTVFSTPFNHALLPLLPPPAGLYDNCK
jgi:hypothetical protein